MPQASCPSVHPGVLRVVRKQCVSCGTPDAGRRPGGGLRGPANRGCCRLDLTHACWSGTGRHSGYIHTNECTLYPETDREAPPVLGVSEAVHAATVGFVANPLPIDTDSRPWPTALSYSSLVKHAKKNVAALLLHVQKWASGVDRTRGTPRVRVWWDQIFILLFWGSRYRIIFSGRVFNSGSRIMRHFQARRRG